MGLYECYGLIFVHHAVHVTGSDIVMRRFGNQIILLLKSDC